MRIEERMVVWNSFRRALCTEDKIALDEAANAVRNRASAGGMMQTPDPLEPMVLSTIVDAFARIRRLEARIEELETCN
jgi:hypothetical protein